MYVLFIFVPLTGMLYVTLFKQEMQFMIGEENSLIYNQKNIIKWAICRHHNSII